MAEIADAPGEAEASADLDKEFANALSGEDIEGSDDSDDDAGDDDNDKKSDPKKADDKPKPKKAEEKSDAEDTDEGEDADDTSTGDDDDDDTAEGEEDDDDSDSDPKERNRRGFAERQKVRADVTATLDKIAKPQTAEELIESKGLEPAEAEVEALRQEMQRNQTIQEITELNNGLHADAENVIRDFPVFDAGSDDYDGKFAERVDALWKEAADYKTNESGDVVLQARIPIYKFYQTFADARDAGVAVGEARGQKVAEKELAAVETPAASKPAAPADKMSADERAFLKGLTEG